MPIPPERDLSGEWIDKATGVEATHITGEHLLLPGHGENGPTLEIFSYDDMPEHPNVTSNTPGFGHIAFAVDDVPTTAHMIFERGGSAIGELTMRKIPEAGYLTFQYVTDPEGNIVEIQSWDKNA